MSLAKLTEILVLALLQGALVALPRANALAALHRFRSPAWALILPGMIAIGTIMLAILPSGAIDLVVLGTVATPLLAAVAMLAVVRREQRILVVTVLILCGIGAVFGAWAQQLSVSAITALGCLTLGAALVRLIPPRWALAGVIAMCVLDGVLALLGIGTHTPGQILMAGQIFHGLAFDHAQVGMVYIDYPDLLLAAAIGGFLADHPAQRRAALLVVGLAMSYDLLLTFFSSIPETVPLTLAFVLARFCRIPARLRKGQRSSIPDPSEAVTLPLSLPLLPAQAH